MKKVYESPVAEVVSFAALEQMATLKTTKTVTLPTALSLTMGIEYSAEDRTSLANF